MGEKSTRAYILLKSICAEGVDETRAVNKVNASTAAQRAGAGVYNRNGEPRAVSVYGVQARFEFFHLFIHFSTKRRTNGRKLRVL